MVGAYADIVRHIIPNLCGNDCLSPYINFLYLMLKTSAAR